MPGGKSDGALYGKSGSMTQKHPTDIAASIQAKLLHIAHTQRLDYNLMLKRYAMERLLYRLSRTAHMERFVLKGAVLFYAWGGSIFRPTKDLDLLGFGDPTGPEMVAVFREVANKGLEAADGLILHADSVESEPIRDGDLYAGLRITLRANLGKSEIKMQVDIGFGDAVVPGPVQLEFPTLLEGVPFQLRAYQPETVIAEKLDALVKLEYRTSRMKDLYDIWILSETRQFSSKVLSEAVRATFVRRGSPFSEETPAGLTSAFYSDPRILVRWQAWLRKTPVKPAPDSLEELGISVSRFLLPVWERAKDSESGIENIWKPGVGWKKD